LIVDSGDGRYAAQVYGPNFFETTAHNCVLIDGHGQVGDNSRPLAGKIVEHRDVDGLSTLLADAGACYEGMEQCRRRVVFVRPDLFIIADRVRGDCTELTWLLHAFNGDGAARWEIEGRRMYLVRPGARLDVFLLEVPAGTAISAGTLDGKPGGTLRLAASIRGKAVTAVLVPSRADEPAPEAEWRSDGSMVVRFRGRVTRIGGSEERVTCDGREFLVQTLIDRVPDKERGH